MDFLSRIPTAAYLFIAISLYLGLFSITRVIRSIRKYNRIRLYGLTTMGSIAGYKPRTKQKGHGESEHSLMHMPTVEYRDHQGVVHTLQMPELISFKKKPLGTSYPIKFDPEKPQHAIVDDRRSFRVYVLGEILACMIAFGMLAALILQVTRRPDD
jgi:hypothetical protein